MCPSKRSPSHYDAILLCGGAEQPRDLKIPGRELKGIHFAMEFLPQQNRRNEGDWHRSRASPFCAEGKRVVIIGGGDTGADCLGTSLRQGAKSVHQFEIMPKPPEQRAASTPWPLWPLQLRTESSHEEGGIRDWSINSVKFTGDENGNVKQLHAVRVGPPPKFEASCRLRVHARCGSGAAGHGLPGPGAQRHDRAAGRGARQPRQRGHRRDYMSSVDGVFAAGDMRRGQSLVVWAIAKAAKPPPPSTVIWPPSKHPHRSDITRWRKAFPEFRCRMRPVISGA